MTIQLAPKKIKVASLLASGENITSIAKELDIARTTIYDWINNDSHFNAYMNRLKTENLESARTRIQSASTIAITTLVNVMKKSTNDIARINAATKVLEMAGMTKDTCELYGRGIGSESPEELEAEKNKTPAQSYLDSLMPEYLK